MSRKRIGIVTTASCDLVEILRASRSRVVLLQPIGLTSRDLEGLDALALLGGVSDVPLLLGPRERAAVEAFIAGGKPVFAEFCESISDTVYCAPPVSTRFERLVFCGKEGAIPALTPGDILDDQCNSRISPYFSADEDPPLLSYAKSLLDHRATEVKPDDAREVGRRALWLERENLLVCAFRICNWSRARFAPRARWAAVIAFILRRLCGEDIPVDVLPSPYRLGPVRAEPDRPVEELLRPCVERAVRWFSRAGMLVDRGRGGVREGLGTEIYPDGAQRIVSYIRDDCSGETALAFLMHSLLTGSKRSLRVSDNLLSLCFDAFRVKEGPHRGMMRWTDSGWGVCYQDDVARAVIPALLRRLYTGDDRYVEACVEALRFLVRTTGTDGTRVPRTDIITLSPAEAERLASQPAACVSAHYNAYYHAALLLAHHVTRIEEFRAVAVRGLESIMAAYPDTRREISETEELCRLVLPLAWLGWITGEPEHRGYLDRVISDLRRFAHPSGGYLEWDTGYQAKLSRKVGGESSLLARNGDPVVEMLYSLNWLPMAFAQAYAVTGEESYRELWRGIARFFLSTQISSANPLIDGAWTRALDVELMEVYGVPNDVGWGPWAVESGWTVGEIASGLAAGLLAERLKPLHGR